MSVVINGVAIRWALPDFAITETAVGKFIFQSADQTKMDEPETIRDKDGQTVSRIWPDPSDEITFSGFIVSRTGNSIADAKTQTLLVKNGTIVTLTFSTGEYAGFTTGAKAEIQTGKLSGSNTSCMKCDLTLRIWPQITAVASA